MAQKLECNWCGKESVVWWRGETLCDNCWNGVKIDLEARERYKIANTKINTFRDLIRL